MVRVGWERHPLLLFSDVHRIGLESFQHFQTPTNGSVNKHNVQMGLQKGILSYCIFLKMGLLIKLSLCP